MTKSKEESKNTLTEKVKDKIGKIQISKSTGDLLSKIGIYSVNYFPELLSNLYQAKTSIGNAYGAIGFAALDVLARKNTSFKRLSKFGGYLWYVGEGIYDLTLALNDQENVSTHLGNFALDVSMAYQLGKDMGSLYKELNENKLGEDKKLGVSKDLGEIVSFFKGKFRKVDDLYEKIVSEKDDDSEEKDNSKEDDSKSFKNRLSNFGKNALTTMELGVGMGYGFGKSAFEKLKENYSVYRTKRKESNELKKIKNEKIRQERAEQKIKNADLDEVSFKKKKEILEYLGDCEKNPKFMEKYEIENEYANFKQKPIDEQIQIMVEEKDSLKKKIKQMEIAPLTKRISNAFYIFDTKSELKGIEEILWELDVEKKNPPKTGKWR